MDIEVSKKNHELKKHVGAIHSSNTLTLLQRKIANALLFNAYDKLLEQNEYSIHINQLCLLIGYDSKDYKTIRKALINLLSTVIEWNLVDGKNIEGEGVWNASSIIADASIDGPICTYSYSNKMRQLLYRPELYGKLNMLIQAKFKSNYGLALYENCIRYQNIQQTPWIDLTTFRKLMGVAAEKYPIFRDFKKRVLDKAITEVNEYSNIQLNLQLKRVGRQVTEVKFLLGKNEAQASNLLTEENPEQALQNRLIKNYGLSLEQAKQFIINHPIHYILEKMQLIEESRSYREGKIQNLSVYLQHALKENYQQPKSSQAVVLEQQKTKEKNKVDTEKQKALMVAYKKYQDQAILKRYENLEQKEQQSIHKKFKKFLEGSLYARIFERDGFKNLLVGDQFCLFVRQHHPDWLREIPTYQAYYADA